MSGRAKQKKPIRLGENSGGDLREIDQADQDSPAAPQIASDEPQQIGNVLCGLGAVLITSVRQNAS